MSSSVLPASSIVTVTPARRFAAHGAGPLAGLLALSVFILAMLWTGVWMVLQQDRANTRAQAMQNLANLTRAFAEHTAKSIEGADQAVRFVRSEYLRQRSALDIAQYLSSQAIIDSDYHLLSVLDADGFVTHSSQPFKRVDLHEREHFRVHAQGTADRLFVSKPVLGKVSGKWSIQITRRINEPDGRFGGVVVVSMPPSYFTRFYEDVDLGEQGVIALVGRDGQVRARASRAGQEQGNDLRASPVFREIIAHGTGVMQARSRIDGVERFYAYRSLPYDLVVVTGIGVAEAMAEYADRRNVTVLIAALVSLITIAFSVSLFQRARRQSQLVEALRESEVRAQAANRLKSHFIASVSHELRTPLNGILGYAELIRDTANDAQAAEFGGIVFDSARHLHGLVNTLLDLARIESGHLVAQRTPTPLRPLLEECHRLHVVHAQARGLSFTLTVEAACPQALSTDRTRLLQVLSNVINNAIKFTEQGGVALWAGVEGRHLLLRVSDTGIGIAADRLDSLFTRFQGAAGDLVHANQGAGLGLPLAKELTELLGGTLSLRSTLGEGTEVCLSLPLDAAAPPGEAAPDSHAATGQPS